mgnify:FL=1
MRPCEEDDCRETAGAELHVPWRATLRVYPVYARVWARKDGVVPEPPDGHDADWL